MSYVEKMDKYIDYLRTGKSEVVDSWFMMSGPVPITTVVIAYLLFITIGPKLMKNREPMKMNKLLMYYNVFQVLLATLICVKVTKLNLFLDGVIYAGCRYPSNTQNPILLDLGWWYFFAKFTELLDTVFFVLRKKNKQISFLHVYHHAIMAIYSWSYLKFAAGGDGAILALLNSAVHVVMYTYYLLAGLGPTFQKWLWWKKYVTKMQLTQFGLMLAYCGWTHYTPRCQYSTGFTYFISTNVVIFLFLFLNFYTKSYKGKGKKSAEDEIKQEYEKLKNGYGKNGFNKTNGIKCEKKENGVCENDCKSVPDLGKVPFEVSNGCGDYTKGGNVFLTRRTATAVYGSDYELNGVIKK